MLHADPAALKDVLEEHLYQLHHEGERETEISGMHPTQASDQT
jgi:hypothetical protein